MFDIGVQFMLQLIPFLPGGIGLVLIANLISDILR